MKLAVEQRLHIRPIPTWFFTVIISVCALVILPFIYIHAAYSVDLNSDTVNALLQGNAIADGNYLLDGWTFSNVSFYTTDLLYYALLTFLDGFHFTILKIGPAIIYTLIVMLSGALAIRRKSSSLSRVAIVLLLIAFPVQDMAVVAFSPMDHTNTLVFVLCAFIFATFDRKMRWMSFVLTPIFLAWACFGDMLTLFIGVIPIAFAALMKRRWILAGLSTLSSVVAHIAATHMHSFTLYPTYYRFAKLQDLPHHFSYAIHGILSLTGADFFGRNVNLQSMLSVLHVVGTIAILYVAYAAVKRWRTLDFISLALISGMIVSLGAFMFSTFPTGDGSDRYLLTFIVFGSILVAREFERINVIHNIQRRALYIMFAMMALTYAVSFFAFTTTNTNEPERQVVNFLHAHNLTHGYGSYWSANILTAISDGSVHVRPVYLAAQNEVSEYDWESNEQWYTQPADFVVFDGTMRIDSDNVTATFGRDDATYHVDKYTIMVWNSDITQKLYHIHLRGGVAWG